ncbi:hypothetical protein [Alkalibacillus salilacus]|uniref:Uncharacterized protein n=1 Tax=Alkalibacillus salilacus TaxID=284582 RepID=A0ABT9VHM9_9BACI|nr:hypothetical protein [Alkalibacillus salilacus]MDQ0160335.1 hypothetical protein [Alkalibacillus salilacus]
MKPNLIEFSLIVGGILHGLAINYFGDQPWIPTLYETSIAPFITYGMIVIGLLLGIINALTPKSKQKKNLN